MLTTVDSSRVNDHGNWVSGISGDAEWAEKLAAHARLVALATDNSKSRLYAEWDAEIGAVALPHLVS